MRSPSLHLSHGRVVLEELGGKHDIFRIRLDCTPTHGVFMDIELIAIIKGVIQIKLIFIRTEVS